jgi:hypothetical protein
MRRLLAAPLVGCGLFTVGVLYGYWNGFLWPVATTAARIVWPRDTPTSEPDPIA